MNATAVIDPWYIEQEARIKAATEESARLRREMRRRFDPGHLYIVQFSSGVMKVGKSASPDSRLEQHAKAGFIERTWVSAFHLGTSGTERKVLSYCAEHGQLHGGREYFTGLNFTSVMIRSMLVVDDARLGQPVSA